MLNKPKGYITATRDERRKTVMELIPESEREGLFHVGRLDRDTEGLLFLTDDGNLCYDLLSPHTRVEKTYRFWAKGVIDDEKIRSLSEGVIITEAQREIKTAPATVTVERICPIKEIAHLFDSDAAKLRNTRRGNMPVSSCIITITEGRKHQVKKMVKAVGMYVLYLERIALGGVILDSKLQRGEYRPLTDDEINTLKESKNHSM
jgi:16S rRNA pseudouridine516 synthase